MWGDMFKHMLVLQAITYEPDQATANLLQAVRAVDQ